MKSLKGIHHVTAITKDAQQNVDFYSGVLGLRLVKKTVNFDDPGSYHLYYGDRQGTPGTLVTFFVWPEATRGRSGTGEPVALAFEVPPGALDWWKEHLAEAGVPAQDNNRVFGSRLLSFSDPDGMPLELVEANVPRESEYWTGGGISKKHAITFIHSITLALGDEASSAALYTGELTFRKDGTEKGRHRFGVGDGAGAGLIDVVAAGTAGRGRMGAGTIHHVAFRTDDDDSQAEWLERLRQLGLHVSPQIDRKYFQSIYFRETGGVLFEIATDGPGMTVDETEQELGERLVLPSEYEPLRETLEGTLPPITSRGPSPALV